MATAQETFGQTIIEPLKVSVGANILSYAEYLELPPSQRSNDEAAVIDIQFTSKLLEWLGYEAGDIIYNRPVSGQPRNKPDFVVKMQGSTAFIIEDKSSDEKFNEASVKQLRRYTAGTSGYCMWINGKTILALRFDPNGQYQILVEIRVDGAFGQYYLPFPQEANFEILHLLFSKQRFTNISTLIQDITTSKEEWQKQAERLVMNSHSKRLLPVAVLSLTSLSQQSRHASALLQLN